MEKETRESAGVAPEIGVQHDIFFEDVNENSDDFPYSDSDREGEDDIPRKRCKRERKVPLSEEEAERKRVLANSQERERMNRLNRALSNLRRALPMQHSVPNRRLSKIRTLRLAVSYIRGLSRLLHEDDARHERLCQLQHPYQYPAYPTPFPMISQHYVPQSPGVVPGPYVHGGDIASSSCHDEGYFSSLNETQIRETSFMGSPYPLPTPYFDPAAHPVSPDDGFGPQTPSFVSPFSGSPMWSPGGPSWSDGRFWGHSASTPINDAQYRDTGNTLTFLDPLGSGSVRGGMGMLPGPSQPQSQTEYGTPCRFSTPVTAANTPPPWSPPCSTSL